MQSNPYPPLVEQRASRLEANHEPVCLATKGVLGFSGKIQSRPLWAVLSVLGDLEDGSNHLKLHRRVL